MTFIKPIQTEIITTITNAWQCSKCDKKFTVEDEANAHYADAHAYTKGEWIGENIFLFENEHDFAFWKTHGAYRHTGGCGGAWEGSGWYIITWHGDDCGEYPTIMPAWSKLNLDLENARYTYDQARGKIELFKKILDS